MRLEHRDNCIIVKFMPDNGEADGFYDEGNDKIYIRDKLSLLERECIYYHELTHKECFKKKCKCWNTTSNVLCEYHAMRGELNKVLARNSISLCRAYLKVLKIFWTKCLREPAIWHDHIIAMKKLERTKTFRRLK